MKISFLVKRNLSKPGTHLDPGCYWDYALCQGLGSSGKPSTVGQDPAHLGWLDIFLEYLLLETLVFPFCEGWVLFHLKGKTGHQLLRNFMGLSKAQIGSQGKIKLQLLYGKLNGKERLLPEKREPLPEGVEGVGRLQWVYRNSSSGALDEFMSIPGLILMNPRTHLASV